MILNPPSIVKLYKSITFLINNPSAEHFLANIFSSRSQAKRFWNQHIGMGVFFSPSPNIPWNLVKYFSTPYFSLRLLEKMWVLFPHKNILAFDRLGVFDPEMFLDDFSAPLWLCNITLHKKCMHICNFKRGSLFEIKLLHQLTSSQCAIKCSKNNALTETLAILRLMPPWLWNPEHLL